MNNTSVSTSILEIENWIEAYNEIHFSITDSSGWSSAIDVYKRTSRFSDRLLMQFVSEALVTIFVFYKKIIREQALWIGGEVHFSSFESQLVTSLSIVPQDVPSYEPFNNNKDLIADILYKNLKPFNVEPVWIAKEKDDYIPLGSLIMGLNNFSEDISKLVSDPRL